MSQVNLVHHFPCEHLAKTFSQEIRNQRRSHEPCSYAARFEVEVRFFVSYQSFLLKNNFFTILHFTRFPCTDCPLIFKCKWRRKMHFQTVHSKQNLKFKCEICGKLFIMRANLTNHSRIHTGWLLLLND